MKLIRNRRAIGNGNFPYYLCWLIAGICLGLSIYFCFSEGRPGLKQISGIYKMREALRINPYGQIDALFRSLAKDGHAAIRFRGFEVDDPAHISFITRVYFRGTYIAYPSRLYISTGEAVINDGRDIWQVNQNSGIDQAVSHNISNLVIFEHDRNTGHVNSKVLSLTRQ